MAKIFGIQLKAVRSYMTSDGYAVFANVYLKNKMVGEIYDEGVGAGLWGSFKSKEIENELIEIVKKYYEKYPTFAINSSRSDFGMLMDFFDDFLLLCDVEKDYKSNCKKGFPITLLLKTHSREEDPFAIVDNYKSPIILGMKVWDEKAETYIREKYPKYKNIEVFSKLEDFIIE